MTKLLLRKRFDLAEVSSDWKLVRFAIDWDGRPLLLFVGGKPPQPDFDMHAAQGASPGALGSCKLHTVSFDQSQGLSTFHMQRYEEGWLLGERRNGKATLHDARGGMHRTLDLGGASEDLQTTTDGRIWVSYFDEGVFGNGIGRQGLVCFDHEGTPLFRYADYAEQHDLPMIADCYAMNVDQTGAAQLLHELSTGTASQLRSRACLERDWIFRRMRRRRDLHAQ